MTRRQFVVAACAAVALLAGAAALADSRQHATVQAIPDGPLVAVVSYAPPEVTVVDARAWRVVRRVRLRSVGTDPVALPGRRALALAQCGGVGADADDAVGVVDLGRGGAVTYLKLDCPNPGSVDVLSDGTLAVGHGWEDDAGWVFSHVDTTAGVSLGERRIRNASTPPVYAAGYLWTWGAEAGAGGELAAVLRRTTADFRESVVVGGAEGCFVLPDGESAHSVLRVWLRDGGALVERLDAASLGVVSSAAVGGVVSMISGGATTGEHLVLVDASAVDPALGSGPLLVLDRGPLALTHRITAGGTVTSVAALGETLYAVTLEGTLVEIDLRRGRVTRRLELGGVEGRVLQAAVIP